MKSLLQTARFFFRPAVVFPLPLGITADNTGNLGLFGFMQNANTLSNSMTSTATAGTAITLTTGQLLAGITQLNTGASGGFTITTPSASAITAALGNTAPMDGTFSKKIDIVNNGVGQTGTLTAGTGVTIVGTATIATDTKRTFMLRALNSAAVSITNIGSLSL